VSELRVVIVDDHPLFREGVAATLNSEPDMKVVGEGGSAADALALATALLPDIMLLDVTMPGGGLSAAQAVSAACPVTKIVMLTFSEAEDDVVAALKYGPRGYILKGVTAQELKAHVRHVQAGDVSITASLAAGLLLRAEHRHLAFGSTCGPAGRADRARAGNSRARRRGQKQQGGRARPRADRENGQALHE
jgi:DNA-binding NarL/FixJ family response regulator